MFEKAIKKLAQIDVNRLVLEEFEKEKEAAFDLNTEEQLFKLGIDSDGEDLGDYAPLTIAIRSSRGLPIDRITLRFEGDFHNSWVANFNTWPIVFDSTDPKTGEIVDQFGEDIFGLTDRNLKKFLDQILRDAIQKTLKKRIQAAISSL